MRAHLCRALLLFSLGGGALAQRSVRLAGNRLTLLHVSDSHIHPGGSCREIEPSPYGCTATNTSRFLRSIVELDMPDMVAFTGDTIDHDTTQPRHAMDLLYGVAVDARLPWAASLGNHEDEVRAMSRDEVLRYILKMPGDPLGAHGPVARSDGNFYVDLLPPAASTEAADSNASSSSAPVARLVFFDSRQDNVSASINGAQLSWLANLSATLPPVPTLAFYHIPLPEYELAVMAGSPVSGGLNEAISIEPPAVGAFELLRRAGVVAGFCGHDHTNDICVEWDGVQLCYEGGPGFQGYGVCDGAECYARRARLTELRLSDDGRALEAVASWKRLDGGGATAGPYIDLEVLWERGGGGGHNASVADVAAGRGRVPLSADAYARLPRRRQLAEQQSRAGARLV